MEVNIKTDEKCEKNRDVKKMASIDLDNQKSLIPYDHTPGVTHIYKIVLYFH